MLLKRRSHMIFATCDVFMLIFSRHCLKSISFNCTALLINISSTMLGSADFATTPAAAADSTASFRKIVINNQSVTVLPSGDDDRTAVKSFVHSVALEKSSAKDQRSFFVVDLDDVIRKYQAWTELLPGVTPHYAVKCNDDPVLLSALARLGSNFDCASKDEIHKVCMAGAGSKERRVGK
jgi:hypothetical protein